MKVLAINGSPRKQWNTAKLLEQMLAGAASVGAQTRIEHLYDHAYVGCKSCFACKRIGSKGVGRCSVSDGISEVLDSIPSTDVLILGSPIYFGVESGEMRSFLERLLFPYLSYSPDPVSFFEGKLKVIMLYTMNISETMIEQYQYDKLFAATTGALKRIFGNCELFLSTDTLQFNDYSKYWSQFFDAKAKLERHESVFVQDCDRAFLWGQNFTREGLNNPAF